MVGLKKIGPRGFEEQVQAAGTVDGERHSKGKGARRLGIGATLEEHANHGLLAGVRRLGQRSCVASRPGAFHGCAGTGIYQELNHRRRLVQARGDQQRRTLVGAAPSRIFSTSRRPMSSTSSWEYLTSTACSVKTAAATWTA